MEDVWEERFKRFINQPFKYHVAAGFLIRIMLISYADFHDQMYAVQYTDVDYKVFTDAARHVVFGRSPYKRQTYRYSPLIAFILTPNILIHQNFGKVLFSLFDLLIAIACKDMVERQLGPRGKTSKVPSFSAQLWLYNPLSIAISTRGNADSLPCFFIIMCLFFLRTEVFKNIYLQYSLAGFLLGLSIHLRLYPIAFSFGMFLTLGSYDRININTGIFDGFWLLLPNRKQMTLTISCIVTVAALTYGMYSLYGYEFLFETYIYHLFRKDTRHNFSVLFYHSYLTMEELEIDVVKVLVVVLEILIVFMLSLKFGVKQDSLPFAMLCQAIVLVTFNTVLTSQYFIWFLSLLPITAHCFKISSHTVSWLASLWLLCQAAWLYNAYMLEFRNQDVFIFLWVKSIFFFIANICVLTELIKAYRVRYGFGLMNTRNNDDRKDR